MFAFNRSAAAVLLPLALLVAVVAWSNLGEDTSTEPAHKVESAPPTLVARAGQQPGQGS